MGPEIISETYLSFLFLHVCPTHLGWPAERLVQDMLLGSMTWALLSSLLSFFVFMCNFLR